MADYTAFPIANRPLLALNTPAFSAGTITLDMDSAVMGAFATSLTGNVNASGITITNAPGAVMNTAFWLVTVDSTGGYTWPPTAFPTGSIFANDWAPDLSADSIILIVMRSWDGGTTWLVSHNSPLALATTSAPGLMSAAQFDKLALLDPSGSAVNAQTGTSYTVVDSDKGLTVTLNNAAPVTVNVDTNALTFVEGNRIDFVNLGAGAVTIQGGGTTPVTITQKSTQTAVLAQYGAASLFFTSDTAAVLIGGMNAV